MTLAVRHRKLQTEREGEILRMIAILPEECVVVGGYAVNAYAPPRESVDLDAVVGSAKAISKLLANEGYRQIFSDGFDNVYSGTMGRYEKQLSSGPATVDLLIGSLQTRQTGAVWPYKLIFEDSGPKTVNCRLGAVKARVPSKEMLLAMKMHASRFTDARDIGMMCLGKVDIGKLGGFLARGDLPALESNLKKLVSYAGDRRYLEGLKSVYSMGGGFDEKGLSRKTTAVLSEMLKVIG